MSARTPGVMRTTPTGRCYSYGMTIRTFGPTRHLGCPIYVRNFGHTWEYLAVIRGELYSAHNEIRTTGRRVSYTEAEDRGIVRLMRTMAETTVEHVRHRQLGPTLYRIRVALERLAYPEATKSNKPKK